MKLGSKPPRTCCSILCNLSSVTRARGAAQCTNGKSCNPGDLTFWEGTGRLVQFTVEGEEAVGVEEGGLVQLGGKHPGKQRRYATVHREVAGQDPLPFRLMFPQKPPTGRCRAVFRTKSWRSARPTGCNWIL